VVGVAVAVVEASGGPAGSAAGRPEARLVVVGMGLPVFLVSVGCTGTMTGD
jgi:hypothetical protein